MRFFFFLFLTIFSLEISAQHTNFNLGNSYFSNYDSRIYLAEENIHTSFKPLVKSDFLVLFDDINNKLFPVVKNKNWYYRKIFSEHLFLIKGKDYQVSVSPILNLNIGKELVEKKNTFTNTRGYIVEGHIGNNISFYSSFNENQSIFPNYLDLYIRKNKVVPGQGYARDFKQTGFDYAMSSGYISYKPNSIFVIQFGHSKNFIGDGYRSLFLSDNTFNYPFLKIRTTFGNFQYVNLYTEFQDINYFENNGLDNYNQMGYAKKYMSAHHLSINLTNRLNISFFESVIWRMKHAPGSNGFDVNYLNPIIMLRPIEFSLNSPDNVLIGLASKYRLFANSYLYSQFILDEFSMDEFRDNSGWWGNKYGFQFGYKIFNLFDLSRLSIRTEYNLVRPYTYAHHNPQQNYAHYNQPLAHPLGANFSELVIISRYKFKQWEFNGKFIFAKYGGKISGDPTSYGNDIYQSTGDFETAGGFVYTGRPSDFSIEQYQGNLTLVKINQFNISYVINPRTNFKINIGFTQRNFNDEESEITTNFFNIGMFSDLFNYYYDF